MIRICCCRVVRISHVHEALRHPRVIIITIRSYLPLTSGPKFSRDHIPYIHGSTTTLLPSGSLSFANSACTSGCFKASISIDTISSPSREPCTLAPSRTLCSILWFVMSTTASWNLSWIWSQSRLIGKVYSQTYGVPNIIVDESHARRPHKCTAIALGIKQW